MNTRIQNHSYDTVSCILHWLMAGGFFFMLFTAIAWNINEDFFSLMGLHKSIGICLLLLAIIRLIWAILHHRSRPKNTIGASIGHAILYLLMFAVPMMGALRQYGKAKEGFEVFGVTIMPAAAEKITWMVDLGNNAHGKLGFLLFFFMFGHILMAIMHQIRGEKIMQRMNPFVR